MNRTIFACTSALLVATTVSAGPARGAEQRYSAYQSNLIATNTYQAEQTLNAFRRQANADLNALRDLAEGRRQDLAKVRQGMKQANARTTDLAAKLNNAEQAAADAQAKFTEELARRDAAYARDRAALVASANEFLKTPDGVRYLELVNRGDKAGWEEAKEIWRRDIVLEKLKLGAKFRVQAPQALSKRDVGQETTADVIKLYEELTAIDPSNHWDWVELGRLYRERGDLAKAGAAAEWAGKTALDERDRSVAFEEAGDVAAAQNQLEAARTSYTKSLAIREKLAHGDPTSAERQHDLLVSYEKLGDIAIAQDENDAASIFYGNSFATAEQLVRNYPNSENKRILAISYVKLGDLAVAQRQFDDARTSYTKSLSIREELERTAPTSADRQRDMMIGYSKVGDVAVAQRQFDAARAFYDKSLAIAERLAREDPTSAYKQSNLWITYWRMAAMPGGEAGWVKVRDQLKAMKDRGILSPANEKFLVEATRRAAQTPAK